MIFWAPGAPASLSWLISSCESRPLAWICESAMTMPCSAGRPLPDAAAAQRLEDALRVRGGAAGGLRAELFGELVGDGQVQGHPKVSRSRRR
jgi:hypothetical protein